MSSSKSTVPSLLSLDEELALSRLKLSVVCVVIVVALIRCVDTGRYLAVIFLEIRVGVGDGWFGYRQS
jgi:hypothetical protein